MRDLLVGVSQPLIGRRIPDDHLPPLGLPPLALPAMGAPLVDDVHTV